MSDFDKDTWATPQYLFNWLNSIYNFDVDLCADKDNHKVNRYFTKKDNALEQSWSFQGKTGYCNPPYSNTKPWIEKAMIEAGRGFTTVMLIPTPNGESYYHKLFMMAASITFITGRIAFYNPSLKKYVSGNPRGSCVVEFSKKFSFDLPVQIKFSHRDTIKGLFKDE